VIMLERLCALVITQCPKLAMITMVTMTTLITNEDADWRAPPKRSSQP
jgi:hypothetical protein